LRFELIDKDSSTTAENIGECFTTLGAIAGSPSLKSEVPLKVKDRSEDRGTLIANIVPVIKSNWDIQLIVAVSNLPGHTSCLCMTDEQHQMEILRVE